MRKSIGGFTIVELLIVVIVIAILAAISLVAFSGLTDRANYAKAQSDLKTLNNLVQQYYAVYSSYPTTNGSWSYQSNQGNNFIPGLVPEFADNLPKDKINTSQYSYIYFSNGVNYKLLRHTLPEASGGTGLPSIERSNNPLYDAPRPTWAWGYWSAGAVNW